MTVVLWTQLLTTVFMAGVIWTIALVHYPSFPFVAAERFAAFHQFHSARISIVVILPMCLELATALWLAGRDRTATTVVVALLTVAIWVTTFAVVVPNHNALGDGGADEAVIRRLIMTNWIRTALWTIKIPFVIALMRSVRPG